MLGSLQILLLICGFLSGAGETKQLWAQPTGSCWLRTDCLVLNPGNGAVRWPVDSEVIQLAGSLNAMSVEPVADDNLSPQASGPASGQADWSTRLSRTFAAQLTEFRESVAHGLAAGLDFVSAVGIGWEQLYCARVAANASEAEQRFADYWEYYAARDRWLPGETFRQLASGSMLEEEACRWPSPFDRQLAFLANDLPKMAGQTTTRIAQGLNLGLVRSAQALLQAQDRFASWKLSRGLRIELKGLPAWPIWAVDRTALIGGWTVPHRNSLRISLGVERVSREIEAGVARLVRAIEAAVSALVVLLGRLPVEALGQVWPE